jgi:hypothetical protein
LIAKHGRVLPLVGELAIVIERRIKARRLDCPYIFSTRAAGRSATSGRPGKPLAPRTDYAVGSCTISEAAAYAI